MMERQITKFKKQYSRNKTQFKIQNSTKTFRTFWGFVDLLDWNLFVIYHSKFGMSKYAKLLLITLPIFLFGCSYSFTGSSVPSHLKTIYIPFCIDKTGSGEPTLGDDFTSTLIQQFISDNSLSVSDKSKADAMLDCTINSIQDAPTVIQGGETVSMRRLTINARVVYKDYVMKKTVFEKQFSAYSDYETSGDVSSERSKAILNAIDLVTEDILLAVVSDW